MKQFMLLILFLQLIITMDTYPQGTNTLLTPPVLSEKQIEKLEQGKVVLVIEELASDDILVKAYLIFNKSRSACWDIFIQMENQPDYLKSIAELNFYTISPTEVHAEYVIKWLFITKKFKLIHHYNQAAFYMHWYLDPRYDNDLDEHTGYWQLYEYPGNRTLAAYADNMAISGLPKWLENLIKKQIVKMTMQDIKKYMDK